MTFYFILTIGSFKIKTNSQINTNVNRKDNFFFTSITSKIIGISILM
jgi:hypothetical protein